MNASRLIVALLLLVSFVLGSLPARELVVGPDGETKRSLAGAVAVLDPGLRRFVWTVRVAGSLEEWRDSLGCYSAATSLGLCEVGTGRLVFPGFDGRIPRLQTVYHEVGHALWYNALDRSDKVAIGRLFARGPWPTKYSRKNVEEFFAEIVGLRLSGRAVDGLEDVDRLLDRWRAVR